jgi:hypothetical protein
LGHSVLQGGALDSLSQDRLVAYAMQIRCGLRGRPEAGWEGSLDSSRNQAFTLKTGLSKKVPSERPSNRLILRCRNRIFYAFQKDLVLET